VQAKGERRLIMLRSLNDLRGYTLRERDGDMGIADDFLFDDHRWVIRYLVADTGTWLPGRLVLISPYAITAADWLGGWLALGLSKDEVEHSPDVSVDKPVSRQIEEELAKHYTWPAYWLARPPESPDVTQMVRGDSALRSAKEVTGYRIEAADGRVGHVEDFVVDDEDWSIRFVVVDTRDWLPARKVVIAPQQIQRVNWSDQKVHFPMTREQIKNGPEYDPAITVRREDEKVHPR
jgi:hypothetical protein